MLTMRLTTGVLLASMLIAGPAAAQEDWTTSKWGPDDEIGAANLITEESVMEAAKLVTNGKTYHLGIIVDSNTPAAAKPEPVCRPAEPDLDLRSGPERHDLQ